VPTYQYVCSNPDGKHEFEVVQSFSDEALRECTVCGAPVRKVYGSVGVVFKGSGFYRTDSRAAAAKGSSNGSAKESAGKSSESSSSSSDSSSSSTSSSSSSSASSSSPSSGSSSGSSSSGGNKAAG
jgi:putative FmdB family regulatory protein